MSCNQMYWYTVSALILRLFSVTKLPKILTSRKFYVIQVSGVPDSIIKGQYLLLMLSVFFWSLLCNGILKIKMLNVLFNLKNLVLIYQILEGQYSAKD